jgi:hypothetical protein
MILSEHGVRYVDGKVWKIGRSLDVSLDDSNIMITMNIHYGNGDRRNFLAREAIYEDSGCRLPWCRELTASDAGFLAVDRTFEHKNILVGQ